MRWIPSENLHLTLVFLGATDPAQVPSICAAIESVAAAHSPIPVETGKGGGRVHSRRGGVAWLRLSRGERAVAQLSRDLDRAIGSNTYPPGRAPRPHLTVARGVTDEMLAGFAEGSQAIDVRWVVDRVVLFRSHTGPSGSRYEELASWLLTGAATRA